MHPCSSRKAPGKIAISVRRKALRLMAAPLVAATVLAGSFMGSSAAQAQTLPAY